MLQRLLVIGIWFVLIGVAIAEDETRFHEGDSVRFNGVSSAGSPTQVIVFKSTDEQRLILVQAGEAQRAGRPVSTEGVVCIGHNTPGTVANVAKIEVDGREIETVQVILSSGTLQGEKFWVGRGGLRFIGDRDPAKDTSARPVATSIRDLRWDAEYRPMVGDEAVIAAKDAKTRRPQGTLLYPGDMSVREVRTAMDEDVGNADRMLVSGGTKVRVVRLESPPPGAFAGLARVAIISGPFAGQTCWVVDTFLCRPEVFERATKRR